MENKEKNKNELITSLDIPLDAVRDLPKIEITGKNEAFIENFRGIVDYNSDSVKINTKSGIVKIDGSDLCISYITDEGISIRGLIVRIEFI